MKHVNHQNVLVTGGTGLVGSHLVELLLRRGYTVTCLVRDPARIRWLEGLDVRLIPGDCLLPGSLESAVKEVSLVFHVAGLTKAKRAKEYYEVNHLGTKNILEACARSNPGIRKFVLVSSLAAAGPSGDGRPVKDTDRPVPVSDYGRSKLLAEEETLRYKGRFPVVILRPSAVYGPRDTDMYELFRWASKGLWIELAGGDRFINPCYAVDLAAAMLLAAEKQTASGSIYFVAENRSYSWSEFRQALLSSGGVKARTVTMPCWAAYFMGLVSEFGSLFRSRPALTNRQKVREAVQRYWTCDLTKIENELGFRAAFPLEKGLKLTWEWYRKQGWIA